jgi:exopolysaccharide biosynthesis polyprenyl glycosylphosphotransferase
VTVLRGVDGAGRAETDSVPGATPEGGAPAYVRLDLPSGSNGLSTLDVVRIRLVLAVADILIAVVGTLVLIWFGQGRDFIIAAFWAVLMALRSSRHSRVASVAATGRIVTLGVTFTLAVTLVELFTNDLHGVRVAVAVSLGIVLLSTLVRYGLRVPRVHRSLGIEFGQSVIVVGTRVAAARTIREWQEDARELRVIGVCLPKSDSGPPRVYGVPVLGTINDTARLARAYGPDLVAVHDVGKLGGRQLAKLEWALEEAGSQLSVITPMTNTGPGRTTVRQVGRRVLIDVDHHRPRGAVAATKQLVDQLIGLALLVVAAPMIGVCALLVKLTSPGPAFFRQTRVRENGRHFTMFKLRSMRYDAETSQAELLDANEIVGGGLFKIKSDPRVTPVGRWLRRLSIDELPQLLNVVKGDMSLIGPRPALPAEVLHYDEHARRRLAVKPGLTGLWQVSGRSNLTWEESVRIDADYVDNWRPGRDVAIALKTVRAVLGKDGAY